MLHTKYQSSRPYGFRQEDFFHIFPYISGIIYAILKEGIMGNIQVKLYEICTSDSGDVFYRHFLSRALAAPSLNGENHLCNFS